MRWYLASADPEDLSVHRELVQTMYHELNLSVRVDALDPDSKSAGLTNRLGLRNFYSKFIT